MTRSPVVTEPEGWCASLTLGFEHRDGRSVLAHKRQRGPLAVQRTFHPGDGACHLYLLHPPGGVVGGDRLDVSVDVAAPARALITTPGAAKFYRSAGPHAAQRQRLRVPDGGSLEWFPRESILFPGARVDTRTEVDLEGGARFIGWEILALGRPAIGERFSDGRATLGLQVRRDGRPLLMERLRIDEAGDLDGASGLRGHPVTATFLASEAGPDDLSAVRERLGASADRPAAATLVDRLLVVRCLDTAAERVHGIFVGLWDILRPRLLGMDPCPPRIWAT